MNIQKCVDFSDIELERFGAKGMCNFKIVDYEVKPYIYYYEDTYEDFFIKEAFQYNPKVKKIPNNFDLRIIYTPSNIDIDPILQKSEIDRLESIYDDLNLLKITDIKQEHLTPSSDTKLKRKNISYLDSIYLDMMYMYKSEYTNLENQGKISNLTEGLKKYAMAIIRLNINYLKSEVLQRCITITKKEESSSGRYSEEILVECPLSGLHKSLENRRIIYSTINGIYFKKRKKEGDWCIMFKPDKKISFREGKILENIFTETICTLKNKF